VIFGYRRLKQLHRFETARPASPSELDEVLLPDARAGLTPADMVERRLLHLLEKIQARLSDAESSAARRPLRVRTIVPRTQSRPAVRPKRESLAR
jgi:hypothetical protein